MEHPNNQQEHNAVTAKNQKDKLSIPLAITFSGILVAGAIIFSDTTPKKSPAPIVQIPAKAQTGADTASAPLDVLALTSDDHILGNPNANVVIIEWSDTECPFCKRFHGTMNQIMEQYGKSGDIAWVYRHSPIDQLHSKARKEAEATECAAEQGGNDGFWKYTNKLFELTPGNDGLDLALLPQIATMVGLDAAKLSSCLASGKFADRVERDFVNGVNAGVGGTPYSIVWNRKTGVQKTLNGAQPFENVKAILGIVAAAPAAN